MATNVRRLPWQGLLVTSVAMVLMASAVVIAISTLSPESGRPGTGGQSSSTTETPAGAAAGEPLPAPEGETIVAVLDPGAAKPKVGAEQAIALARGSMGNRVGASPRVQLVQLATRDADSYLNGFVGWIILSTDVPGYPVGPYDAQAAPIIATFTWVHVTADGEVLDAAQTMYQDPGSVPSLPP